jgi:hypothetical protein
MQLWRRPRDLVSREAVAERPRNGGQTQVHLGRKKAVRKGAKKSEKKVLDSLRGRVYLPPPIALAKPAGRVTMRGMWMGLVAGAMVLAVAAVVVAAEAAGKASDSSKAPSTNTNVVAVTPAAK